MRNKNNTESNRRATAADTNILIVVIGLIMFAAGFCLASMLAAAQVALMLAE
jgi:hypothetical protein